MFDPNRMVPRPGGEPTGPKKPDTGVKEGSLYEILQMLDTIVEPGDALSLSEIEFIELKQTIRTESLEILQRKADLLAELKEIIDHKTLLQRLDSYFKEMTKVINNLVSEIKKNKQIPQMLGVEAVEELIKDIKNLLCLDPEKDGDLIDKLQSLPETYLKNNIADFQLALILDGGNKLEKFKERVQAALIHNDDKELKGLIEEISALKIMQVYARPSSPLLLEREAWELIFKYNLLKLALYYQIILNSEGGNKLEKFKERVQAALIHNDDKELKGLVEEISALKIMQVYPRPSSPFPSEIQAYELRVEYDKLNYQAILITEGGNTLEKFKERVQAALERNNYEELKGLIKEISALKIMQVCPRPSSPLISEREAYELRVEYDKLNYQAILITEGGNTLEKFKERVQAALERSDDKEQLEKKQLEDLVRELEGLVQEIFALKIMQVYPRPSSPLISEREAYELKVEYKRMIEMIEEAQRELRKLGPST